MPIRSLVRHPSASLALVGAAVLAAACSSDPLTPSVDVERRATTLPKPAVVKLLERTTPLRTSERATLTVSPNRGGTLRLPNAGLTVVVPVGAVRGPLTISVTAAPGKAVTYDFEPHGTKFNKALTFTQDLEKTTWKNLGLTTLWGGYFPTGYDDANLRATITESFSIRITGPSKGTSASFDIWHFSGYTVSTGRDDGDPNSTLGM
jgi:hypothetical protein